MKYYFSSIVMMPMHFLPNFVYCMHLQNLMHGGDVEHAVLSMFLLLQLATRGVPRIFEKKGQDCARSAQKFLNRKPHPLVKSRAPVSAPWTHQMLQIRDKRLLDRGIAQKFVYK